MLVLFIVLLVCLPHFWNAIFQDVNEKNMSYLLAASNLATTSLHHRRQVAAATMPYKMHTIHSSYQWTSTTLLPML